MINMWRYYSLRAEIPKSHPYRTLTFKITILILSRNLFKISSSHYMYMAIITLICFLYNCTFKVIFKDNLDFLSFVNSWRLGPNSRYSEPCKVVFQNCLDSLILLLNSWCYNCLFIPIFFIFYELYITISHMLRTQLLNINGPNNWMKYIGQHLSIWILLQLHFSSTVQCYANW